MPISLSFVIGIVNTVFLSLVFEFLEITVNVKSDKSEKSNL